ncbi:MULTISPECIES: hypothetical protein [unclassified Methanoregula]|uniref:hypothetical protein n=1 Tax=unclassified Methanoregula TaxID=2649730 RepID=UPI0009CFCF44|nr:MULTISPECIES: hypothetical protein [unclassified Methanoregula]OPX65184.1 MAG: hypothetical protein A4E33_00215 [Methanoregula sp. PtaB.Bin085]OPY32093.1 MAG: hypothetical protein A4E34_02465 [Methanoregula sp. PtaU1.Bin006]
MIDKLPEGKSIGWMQAPPQWIFTHTIRFIGVVRVVIQDGEGFILIKKGKPLVYYFKHGRIELHGHGALDYFNSHPTIEFNLCKYTPEEFAQALKVCNIDESMADEGSAAEKVVTVPARAEEEDTIGVGDASAIHRLVQPASRPMRTEPPGESPMAAAPVKQVSYTPPQPEPATPAQPEYSAPERSAMTGSAKPAMPAAAAPVQPEPAMIVRPASPAPAKPEAAVPVMPAAAIPVKPAAAVPVKPVTAAKDRVFVPQPAILEDPDIRIIGQIKKLNGIVAISVFNEDRNILLMGDVEIEPLLKIARTMLATTRKITPHLDWGSFVHMTLQIPEGNVIIAPYRENHLCILTTRTINIGHIRRILRDLQQDREHGGVL